MTKINVLQDIVPKQLAKSAHIYRQICATIASSLMSASGGIVFGYTAVLLPQLQADDSYPYDQKYDSWIASISPLAMLFGCLFSGNMSDGIGRRMGQIVLIFPFTIGWIVMGLANDNATMLVGRFITGMCTGALRANTMVYIGEITDPKYRSIALFGPSLALHVGVLLCHVLGKYIYWKTACFLFIIPNVITLAFLLFLKESPLWLLTKGKIDEGIESFKLFRGNGEDSEKELAQVLEKYNHNTEVPSFKDNLALIFSKPFMKSLTTIFLLFIAVQWCGINTLSFYAQEIFEKTFSGEIDAFMLMLVTDFIRAFASLVICLFAKIMPRKKSFIISCYGTAIVLLGLVVYLYINPTGLVWLAVLFLVAYIAIASIIACVSWSFIAEIFPSTVRGFGSAISSCISFCLLFISVQATPEIILRFGETVMYAGCAIVTLVAGGCLGFVLPETNGKTLQDIENELYNTKPKNKNSNDVESVPSHTKL